MKRSNKKTNLVLRNMVETLLKYSREYNASIWRAVAEELLRPRRRRRAVNIGRINRYTSPGDCIVVPGKVLGAGNLEHPVIIAALGFSKTALEKIQRAGGKAISIFDLLRDNPRGSSVKIIG
ncbi:MAG: 50S ribosomal protein L18e [Desulfurococcaceae archaeon]